MSRGTMLALDGGVGEVIIAPTENEVSLLKERSLRRAQALAGSAGKGATFGWLPREAPGQHRTVDDAPQGFQGGPALACSVLSSCS